MSAGLPDNRLMIAVICPGLRLVLTGLFMLVTPVTAAIDPVAVSTGVGRQSADQDPWQRIDFRSFTKGNAAQIKVAIRTKGPRMQGLIRIPGAPASNFDTGDGLTVVGLINAGNDRSGYADIVALEILFTLMMPSQFYEVFAVDDGD